MKKALFLLLAIPLLVSCEINQTNNTQVINVAVRQSDWQASVDTDGSNLFYYCTVSMPEITSYVYTNGMVNAYYIFNEGQQMLPYVRHFEVLNPYYTWTRTVDFEYAAGTLTLYATRSDFVVDPPPAMNFRIVVQ